MIAERVRAFNECFFDTAAGVYADRPMEEYRSEGKAPHHALHSSAIPAFYGFLPQGAAPAIAEYIASRGLACGVQFSYFVLEALYRLGARDAGYRLLTGDGDHSWMRMLREGATTTFEAWGKDEKDNTSLCHPWACAPTIIIYEHLITEKP
jgi:hypothetical protein